MNGALTGVRIRTRDETLRRSTSPMRPLLWAWSAVLAVLIASGALWSMRNGYGDWRVFADAGSRVGTHALLDPPQAWQAFFYVPGVAWALVPFGRMPLAASFLVNAVLMLGCAVVAGLIAARALGFPRATAVALFALWSPVVYASTIIGQNAPLGLLLAQAAIAGIGARSVLWTGVPVGLLLYKPTYAIPLIGLLLVRGRVRELGIVAAIGVAWYALSAAAAGGDWAWPVAWWRLIARLGAGDFGVNAAFAVSVPALLVRAGTSVWVAAGISALVAVACGLALRRAGALEAGCAACMAGVALSPHAWAYDTALALPMIAFAAARAEEPKRTRILLAAALIGPSFFIASALGFNPLALIVVGGTALWLVRRFA